MKKEYNEDAVEGLKRYLKRREDMTCDIALDYIEYLEDKVSELSAHTDPSWSPEEDEIIKHKHKQISDLCKFYSDYFLRK